MNQICWRRPGTENIHLDTGTSNSRRKSCRFSWRIRRVSSTTSRLVSGCRWSDKWFLVHVRKLHIPPSRWTPSQTLLAERRIIPYSTEVHWRFQNYSYEFGCQTRTPHRRLLKHRWVKRFFWFLDRFHSVYSIKRETSRRIYMVGGKPDKTASDIQARSLMARNLDEIGKKCLAEGEAEMGKWKTQSSIMQEDYEECISLTLRTWSSSLRKGREENQKFIKYTMDLLSIPDYYIKKGRPHGHRDGKKPGDKEHYIANQLKKKCKKKDFQGIHDRFVRDEQFRSRMFQIGRNEDLCRQMDALADEAHTHHLTTQEYFYYKSNWWLRSNKTGSDTMPVQRRSDFKRVVYLAAIERKRRRRRRSSTKPTMGTKFFFFMAELARFLVDSLFLWK